VRGTEWTILIHVSSFIWSSGFFCRGSGCSLELPERRTAWTVVNCEQFQTVT